MKHLETLRQIAQTQRHRAESAEARSEELRHEANEWADCSVNGLQWLRNIRDGISTPQEAIKDIEKNIAHCREVHAQTTTARR